MNTGTEKEVVVKALEVASNTVKKYLKSNTAATSPEASPQENLNKISDKTFNDVLKTYNESPQELQNVTGGGYSPRYNGASLRINWYKSDRNISRIDLITKSGTTPWTKYEKTFTAPSNSIKATVGGDLFNASGKVWFDDLEFIRIS